VISWKNLGNVEKENHLLLEVVFPTLSTKPASHSGGDLPTCEPYDLFEKVGAVNGRSTMSHSNPGAKGTRKN